MAIIMLYLLACVLAQPWEHRVRIAIFIRKHMFTAAMHKLVLRSPSQKTTGSQFLVDTREL